MITTGGYLPSALLEPAQEPVSDLFVSQLHQAIESRLDDATFGVTFNVGLSYCVRIQTPCAKSHTAKTEN